MRIFYRNMFTHAPACCVVSNVSYDVDSCVLTLKSELGVVFLRIDPDAAETISYQLAATGFSDLGRFTVYAEREMTEHRPIQKL